MFIGEKCLKNTEVCCVKTDNRPIVSDITLKIECNRNQSHFIKLEEHNGRGVGEGPKTSFHLSSAQKCSCLIYCEFIF